MNAGARVGSPAGLSSSAIGYSWRIVGCRSARCSTSPVTMMIGRPLPRRTAVVSGALRSSASLIAVLDAPPMSSCVMKFAVRSGAG